MTQTVVFREWPKIPRLFRDAIITEKIDGTNAAIGITKDGGFYAQSRTRILGPDDKHFGFHPWVVENAHKLIEILGPGLHFGEWWGSGINRNYGLSEKRFSLFNTEKWREVAPCHKGHPDLPQLRTVPVLRRGTFFEDNVLWALEHLRLFGSTASPNFMNPEGVCVYHTAANHCFKVTLENDGVPKGKPA